VESDNELDISSDYTWSNETIQTEQTRDLVLDKVRSWVAGGLRPRPKELDSESQEVKALVSRWTELAVIDGLLVRFRQGKSQVVLPQMRQIVFRHMHASPLSAGHMGRDRTYRRLREKAWWPGYRFDVYKWMRRCVACQLAKPSPGCGRMPLVQERAGAPFERVALDLIGSLPPLQLGKVYLLVMQDCYTKWVETAPLPNKSTPVVAEAFANTWVAVAGTVLAVPPFQIEVLKKIVLFSQALKINENHYEKHRIYNSIQMIIGTNIQPLTVSGGYAYLVPCTVTKHPCVY
jgi:hypothetical protein